MNMMNWGSAFFLGARRTDMTTNVVSHLHDYFELNFLTSGKTRMLVCEKVIEYNSYDFILIPPMLKHILYESEYRKFDNYVIWFKFDKDIVDYNQVIKLHDYEGSVQYLCSEIYRLHHMSDTGDIELINTYLKAVLLLMNKGLIINTDKQIRKDIDIIDNAVKYINTSICNEKITVDSLAKKFNISEAYFTRLFKNAIFISPIKYINNVKMAEAKRMLMNESYSIKEIASRLMYQDQFYFSKQFHQFTGQTPSEYRRMRKAVNSPLL